MAAAAQSQGKQVAGCNYVALDEIWKDHIHLEVSASKQWPESWGFLSQRYEDLVQGEVTKKTRTERHVPTPLRLPPITPIEKIINVKPSPKPFPMTTARTIGWRSSRPEYALERYGRYANPKGGLIKQLNWPLDGID
ncbi:uncharacterized protein C20orf85 homolog [Lingula anatina]|uniref:Uncharacterized protein C20orf85 homolog n=1 Tax=Lingula anatina TaxID=7574 RepID=A0A1S3IFY6_LINAN|nr:uncharacterized protein C20orf85 homolog [Lingula anatina]|eukprot:XP_013396776.1 uncharacterized protein C20orf85 homolog [Lingula anatina]